MSTAAPQPEHDDQHACGTESDTSQTCIASFQDQDGNGFGCPLSQEVLRQPVIAADGHTYEKNAIEEAVAIQCLPCDQTGRQPKEVAILRYSSTEVGPCAAARTGVPSGGVSATLHPTIQTSTGSEFTHGCQARHLSALAPIQ
ncbi:hypothetical protein WJX77_010825 [Trebouxia sp. C0004]